MVIKYRPSHSLITACVMHAPSEVDCPSVLHREPCRLVTSQIRGLWAIELLHRFDHYYSNCLPNASYIKMREDETLGVFIRSLIISFFWRQFPMFLTRKK